MTDSRNVVHSLERANNRHSDHNTEKKNENSKNYKRKSRVKYKNREKDATFKPDGQKDTLT